MTALGSRSGRRVLAECWLYWLAVSSVEAKPPASKTVTARVAGSPQLTPMLRHYLEIKAQHPGAIVLYRMGDFFELFFEDAEIAAPVLQVQLTARQKGTPSEAPMCGVPHHAIESYIGKLVVAGFRVAVCDQVEDPAEAKGLVKREVTRVITPGTVTELSLLDSSEPNLLLALLAEGDELAGALLDISTGSFFVERWTTVDEVIDDLTKIAPREVLYLPDQLDEPLKSWLRVNIACATELEPDLLDTPSQATDRLQRQLGVGSLRGFGLEKKELVVKAAAAALVYAEEAARASLDHVRSIEVRRRDQFVTLDEETLRNLEVFRNQREGTRQATLLWAIDRTVSPGGGRHLKDWLARPLLDAAAIEARLDAVDELVRKASARQRVLEHLKRIGDVERLLARAVLGNMTPVEAAGLRAALEEAPLALAPIESVESPALVDIARVDALPDLCSKLSQNLVAEPPSHFRSGGVIAPGVDTELDRARSLANDGKEHLLALQAREREKTGIGSLKVRYNRVFGYFIEVTKAQQERVPEHYIRKQTLTNAERYFTEELKALEEQVLGAEDLQLSLEEEIFDRLRLAIAAEAVRLRALALALSRLDVFAGLAEVAARHDYCRPKLTGIGGPLNIEDGRHPVVERTVSASSVSDVFVANDLDLDGQQEQIVVLTGPNMGGKSTYLRQVALTALLAQCGGFVPARSAHLPLFDRIFTRVGASDNLARGESTFMVEMIETSNILRYATSDSLIVLDEVGRGTATFDGLSLAWAIVEHLHETVRAKTLFATHYHELTELATILPRVKNLTMAVKEWQERIVFLHRVVAGSADKSYGIQVARLAGLPASVTDRADEVLANLEAGELDASGRPRLSHGEGAPPVDQSQMALFGSGKAMSNRPTNEEVVSGVLKELDIDELTPLAALNLLQTLKLRLIK